MKPVYFPFTSVFDLSAEMISAAFGQTVVYSPSNRKPNEIMQKLAKKGVIDIRTPVKKDEDKLNAILKDYKSWTNLHLGEKRGMTTFLKTQGDKIPFFDDTFTAQIKADIRKKTEQKQPEKEFDPLFQARIFLCIAQEFDMQNHEINQNLFMTDKMQKDLIENIKGEIDSRLVEDAENSLLKPYDPGAYMTADRIWAWALLMQEDQQESGIFVTDSLSVFEYLIDKSPEAETIAAFDSISLPKNIIGNQDNQRDDFMKQLEAIAKNPWSASSGKIAEPCFAKNIDTGFSLTLAVVPDKTPRRFFAGCFGYKHLEPKENPGFKNTLLGLVETKNIRKS